MVVAKEAGSPNRSRESEVIKNEGEDDVNVLN